MNRKELLKEALYYKKLPEDQVRCVLCPHYCQLEPGQRGDCRVRINIDGSLYTENYGKLTGYAYDRIEKKPLRDFMPGQVIFSIGSYGCNLACDFCQNWHIAHGDPRTVTFTDEEIIGLAKAQGSVGIAYTYNEPIVSYEYILHIAKKVKEAGLVNVLVTNGFINPKPLEEILPYIDALNIDLKAMSEDFYTDICHAAPGPVLKTIERASQSCHVEVSNLLIDGLNSSNEEIEALAKSLGEIDRGIPLHLSRYFPAYKMTLAPTKRETLFRAKKIAEKYLDRVYLGNI